MKRKKDTFLLAVKQRHMAITLNESSRSNNGHR